MTGAVAKRTAAELSTFPMSLSIKWSQVDSKKLYISQCLRDRFFLIRSYDTVVGIVDKEEKEFFEIGKYSQTTSRQVNYIHRKRFSDYEKFFVEGRVA